MINCLAQAATTEHEDQIQRSYERAEALETFLTGDTNDYSYEVALSAAALSWLHKYELQQTSFEHFEGNVVQLELHNELVNLVEDFGSLKIIDEDGIWKDINQVAAHSLDASQQLNAEGQLATAYVFADFCHDVHAFCKGLVGGGKHNVKQLAQLIIHPLQTASALLESIPQGLQLIYSHRSLMLNLLQHPELLAAHAGSLCAQAQEVYDHVKQVLGNKHDRLKLLESMGHVIGDAACSYVTGGALRTLAGVTVATGARLAVQSFGKLKKSNRLIALLAHKTEPMLGLACEYGIKPVKNALDYAKANNLASSPLEAFEKLVREKKKISKATISGYGIKQPGSKGAKKLQQLIQDKEKKYTPSFKNFKQKLNSLRKKYKTSLIGYGPTKDKKIVVNFEHILHLDIKPGNKKAYHLSGWHHNFGKSNHKPFHRYNDKSIEIIHTQKGEKRCYTMSWHVKGDGIRPKKSSFFPKEWSNEQVIDKISEAYKYCATNNITPILDPYSNYWIFQGQTKE
jgi:hypothetical protein